VITLISLEILTSEKIDEICKLLPFSVRDKEKLVSTAKKLVQEYLIGFHNGQTVATFATALASVYIAASILKIPQSQYTITRIVNSEPLGLQSVYFDMYKLVNSNSRKQTRVL